MDKKEFQLLINADNISPAYLEVILTEAEKYGEICEKRIYGDWVGTNRRPWKALLAKHSVVPVQAGGAESAITIDALDIVGNDSVAGAILASYDSDFAKLALKLKAAGKIVIGMGDAVTPSAYRKACETFVFFDVVAGNSAARQEMQENACVVREKEADGNVPCDGSCGDGVGVACEETDEAENSAKNTEEEKEVVADTEKTVAEAVEDTLRLSDVEQYIRELLGDEENCGKILMEKLALLLKQKFPLFGHKKFGYSKFPQFIESIADLQVVTAAPTYELEQPKMYVVNQEYINNRDNGADGMNPEGGAGLETVKPAMSLEEIEAAILEIIDNPENGGSISLGRLRYQLKGKYPEFDQRMYGRARFNKFMELIPGVRMVMEEVEEEGQTPGVFVVKK